MSGPPHLQQARIPHQDLPCKGSLATKLRGRTHSGPVEKSAGTSPKDYYTYIVHLSIFCIYIYIYKKHFSDIFETKWPKSEKTWTAGPGGRGDWSLANFSALCLWAVHGKIDLVQIDLDKWSSSPSPIVAPWRRPCEEKLNFWGRWVWVPMNLSPPVPRSKLRGRR